jgi:hypothetical protein
MRKKPAKLAPKAPKEGPKTVKNPTDKPKVSYVYRKDAFNKVKLA